MELINPIWLWGLTGLMIPVGIHLLSRREGKIIKIGSIRHLDETNSKQNFHSVYFREPSGVLFELATRGPGFAVDEPAERLGESLRLPPRYEQMREQLQRTLTPLVNPRAARRAG